MAACRAAEAVAQCNLGTRCLVDCQGDSSVKIQGQDGTLRACALQCLECLEDFGRKKSREESGSWEAAKNESAEAKMDYCFNKSLLRGKIER